VAILSDGAISFSWCRSFLSVGQSASDCRQNFYTINRAEVEHVFSERTGAGIDH
jgi:hypothetical protein